MMHEPEQPHDLPEPLKRELGALYGKGAAFPAGAGRDAAILAAARRAGAISSPAGARRWGWRAIGGVAAALLVAAGVWSLLLPARSPEPHAARTAAREVRKEDGNAGYARTGDIRDAFYVARQLKAAAGSPKALEGQWDVNHDGVVDDNDVRALAEMAVRLPGTAGRQDVDAGLRAALVRSRAGMLAMGELGGAGTKGGLQ